MSADIKTEIAINGTPDELESVLHVFRLFETDMYEKYKSKQSCAYIDKVSIWNSGKKLYLNDLSDDKIRAFVSDSENALIIAADGPYGNYSTLEEVGLFEALAEAASTAGFIGSSSGYITGADVALNGELKNGLLHTSHYYKADEDDDSDGYQYEIEKNLSRSTFSKLFEIDEYKYSEDAFSEFIVHAMIYGGFPDMKYKRFKEFCPVSKLSKDGYKAAIEVVKGLNIMSYNTYTNGQEDDYWDTEKIYDPVSKRYL